MNKADEGERPSTFIRSLAADAVAVANLLHEPIRCVSEAYSPDNLGSIAELVRNVVKGLRSRPN